MADINRDLELLSHRLDRLEQIFLVFLKNDFVEQRNLEDERLSYLFNKYSDRKHTDKDEEFYFLIDRIMRERWTRLRHYLEKIEYHFTSRTDETLTLVKALNSHLQDKVSDTTKQLHKESAIIGERLSTLETVAAELSEDLHFIFTLQTMGLRLEHVPIHRYFPVRVYLSESDETKIKSVSRAVQDLVSAFGFEIADDFPAQEGSWWKKWFARTKNKITHSEVVDRLRKIERAIELQGVYKPQSEVTKNEAESAAALIKAVENVPTAAIQAGTILLIKTNNPDVGPSVQVRTLTQYEMEYLERNQTLLASPHDILVELNTNCQQKNTPRLPD